MSYIGVGGLVAAPVQSHTDGSPITYGTGFVVGPLARVDLGNNINDNPDFADDVEVDNDNGMNGYSGPVDSTYIEDDVMAKLLGWGTVGTGDEIAYEISDNEPPKVGWGFFRKKSHHGVWKYEGRWYHKAQFTQNNVSGATKTRTIEWQHLQLNVTGIGAYIDGTGHARWCRQKTFDTEAEVMAWLYARANIAATTNVVATT